MDAHRVLRTATKRRMMKNLKEGARPEIVASYKGMLSHGNAFTLSGRLPAAPE